MMNDISLKTRFNIFHGSIEQSIDSIIKRKSFHVARRKDHWLGNGVYFFIDDISKAFWWATNARNKENKERQRKKLPPTSEEEAIIFFEIEIERKKLIDLDTEDDRDKLSKFIKELEGLQVQITVKGSEEHEALCALIDMYVAYSGNIDAVKYTFKSDTVTYKILDNHYGVGNNGVQLSLFNQSLLDFENCVKKKRSEWNAG